MIWPFIIASALFIAPTYAQEILLMSVALGAGALLAHVRKVV